MDVERVLTTTQTAKITIDAIQMIGKLIKTKDLEEILSKLCKLVSTCGPSIKSISF